MNELAKQIMKPVTNLNDLVIYWLSGAGFIIKSKPVMLGIDLYLSNTCQNERGEFKRLIPPPVSPPEIKLDYLIATHEHGDHFDIGSVKEFINDGTATKVIGPGAVVKESEKLGIDQAKVIKLERNERLDLGTVTVRGVFADHGEQAPDAIGVIIAIGGKQIYFTGDTCYRPDFYQLVPISGPIDLLIVPINGKYGNPDPEDAAYITAWVKPKRVIPCHFWLSKEHGGDPGEFVRCCTEIAPQVKIEVLAIGEEFIFSTGKASKSSICQD
jgi:L-ascorbate 6-phosphate lactonase